MPKCPKHQGDLRCYWSKKEEALLYSWSSYGPGKQTSGVLAEHLENAKTLLGTTLVEELDKRGYDITSLRFSIKFKEDKKKQEKALEELVRLTEQMGLYDDE